MKMDFSPLDKAQLAEEPLHFPVFAVGVKMYGGEPCIPGQLLRFAQEGGGHAAPLDVRVHRCPVEGHDRTGICPAVY